MNDEHIQITLKAFKQVDEIINNRNKEEDVLLEQNRQLIEYVQQLMAEKQEMQKALMNEKERNKQLQQRINDLEKPTIINNNIAHDFVQNQVIMKQIPQVSTY